MTVHPVLLPTDVFFFVTIATLVGLAVIACRKAHVLSQWQQVLQRPLVAVAAMLLAVFMMITILDSLHYRVDLAASGRLSANSVNSVLDSLLSPLAQQYEKTYSSPFALTQYTKEIHVNADKTHYVAPPLQLAGKIMHGKTRQQDIHWRVQRGAMYGIIAWLLFYVVISCRLARHHHGWQSQRLLWQGRLLLPWRIIIITLLLLCLMVGIVNQLIQNYHIFGTDKIGQDVFYITLKSIRTGVLIGTLTTLVMLPFAVVLGLFAGYCRGIIDDVIQYVYTTLSSIPAVLLIAAAVLSMSIFIDNHPHSFSNIAQRADIRLLTLCFILGITSWTTLCRLLRAEALKLREMDYVQAAHVLSVSQWKIIWRHILPNTMHIILIAVTLDFSGLVLAEAVLSYVGVGVAAETFSWGNMINSARLELAREPIVWWPLLAAFVFMFMLVLSANIVADAIRDAFDPRLRRR